MAAQPNSGPAYRDMLDIIFADRNRAYGAYLLRRQYPEHLRKALLYALFLVTSALVLPILLRAANALGPLESPTDIVAEISKKPVIEAPPPTPPVIDPPLAVTRPTNALVPPVVRRDDEADEKPKMGVDELLASNAEIGKETKAGNMDAAPAMLDNPSELKVVEEPKAPVAEKTYEMFDIQKPPSFPGGEAELLKFLAENIKYPPLARENNIQGVVALTFVVNKNGSVSDVAIVKDIGGGCGKEAMRVAGSMPKWSPGEANGHPVKVRYTLPVRFRLE